MALNAIEGTSANANSVAAHLQKALAETKTETAKAQTFHWNVTGMAFGPLHTMFQEIYEDHFKAEDVIAERLRSLDFPADGRLSESLSKSDLQESDWNLNAKDMIRALAADQRHLSATLRGLANAAEAANDQITADMAINRADIHEKFAWILRAHLVE